MSDKELEEILNEFSTTRKENTATQPEPEKPAEQPVIDFKLEEEKPAPAPEMKFEELEAPAPALELNLEDTKAEEPVVIEELEPPKRYDEEEYPEEELVDLEASAKKGKSPNKKAIIAIIAVVLAAAIGVGVYFAFFRHPEEPKKVVTTVDENGEIVEIPVVDSVVNPLTGEDGYNEAAIGKRPVAVVVENEYSTASVRPQWALSEADIVLEGESEFSTRMLLFWADYTKVPNQVGPTRSARPPFIHFSQLFDSIFIHAGLSHTRGNYTGADTVFKNENIDHVNLLAGDGFGYFDRDYSRTSTVEHTGYLKGDGVPALIEKNKFRTDANANKFSILSFNEEDAALSQSPAKTIEFKWTTKGNCPKKGTYTYNEETKTYNTKDFDSQYGESKVSWKNLVFLLDQTEYVVKENYKGKGSSETYCNYKLSGGKGMVASNGTFIEITWGVTDGKLWMKDADGNDVKLNVGKTYIGYGSENYGGYAEVVE